MTEVESELTFPIPGQLSLQHSCKLAITEDRPIMLDYWADSLDSSILIGVRESGEKLLVKNEDEYIISIFEGNLFFNSFSILCIY